MKCPACWRAETSLRVKAYEVSRQTGMNAADMYRDLVSMAMWNLTDCTCLDGVPEEQLGWIYEDRRELS